MVLYKTFHNFILLTLILLQSSEKLLKNQDKKRKMRKKMKSHKNQVFLKMVRAKPTGPWEGGGFGGKNIQTYNFLRRVPISTTSPAPMGRLASDHVSF